MRNNKYPLGWEVLGLQFGAWGQLTIRHKSGGDLNICQPSWSLLTFSVGMGISTQSLGNLLLPSIPKAVRKQFLKLALPKLLLKVLFEMCLFPTLAAEETGKIHTVLNVETSSSQFRLAYQNV